jgi:plastocyanin
MRIAYTFERRTLARLGAVALALMLHAAAHAAAPIATVDIRKFAFTPQEITVAPGTTVTWTNQDETPHTLTARDATFKSKALDTNDAFTFTFANAGDFAYFCTLHPFMTGVVHVRADAKAGAGTAP